MVCVAVAVGAGAGADVCHTSATHNPKRHLRCCTAGSVASSFFFYSLSACAVRGLSSSSYERMRKIDIFEFRNNCRRF